MKNLTRSRWAAIGAAVAVTLGGGGLIGVSAAETSSTLTPVSPVRVVDTRPTGKVGNIADGASITVQITGAIKTVNEGTKTVVPEGASAIIGNLTLVGTHANDYGGFATVYPCGDRPEASNVNFTSGKTIANSVAVPLSATGTVCIYVYGTAHVLFDVSGYYTTSEISQVAASVVSLEDEVAAVETEVAAVEAEVDAVETEVAAVEAEVDDVADDVSRLAAAQFVPMLRPISSNGYGSGWGYVGTWNLKSETGNTLLGAVIEDGKFSDLAEIEMRVVWGSGMGSVGSPTERWAVCFAIGSTVDGVIAETESCVGLSEKTASTARIPIPDGVLNPYWMIRDLDGGECSWPSCNLPTVGLEWVGFYVYD